MRSSNPEQASRSPAGQSPWLSQKIAVYVARDVLAGADRDTAKAAVAGISPAVEMVDGPGPPEDPERILAGNIYQRHVVLSGDAPARTGSTSDDLVCRILRRGSEFARTSNPQANTGNWVDIVRHVADVLAAFREPRRAGATTTPCSRARPLPSSPTSPPTAFTVSSSLRLPA